MLATLSQRRAIWTLQGPTEVLVRFDGATMGGALRRDGQSRRNDACRPPSRIAAVECVQMGHIPRMRPASDTIDPGAAERSRPTASSNAQPTARSNAQPTD